MVPNLGRRLSRLTIIIVQHSTKPLASPDWRVERYNLRRLPDQPIVQTLMVPSHKAKNFDAKFEKDEDVSGALDISIARRPLQNEHRVSVDLPVWMIESLDREAARLGVTRQSVIRAWLAQRLEQGASRSRPL